MHEHPDTEILIPPGTYLEKVPHPDGTSSKSMEVAIFTEHRFAFYFWNRWLRDLNDNREPPCLLTIDWHRDMAPPSESEKKDLKNLDLTRQQEVARFVWSRMDTHNDSHLLSAAYLNLVGDVFLLKNYGERQHSTFIDCHSNRHQIFEYGSFTDLQEAVLDKGGDVFFLDVDLDFFIRNKVAAHQLQEVATYSDEEISALINNESPLFTYLYDRLAGITIATEPRYCGGILKSNRILDAVLGSLFTPDMQWKHLQD